MRPSLPARWAAALAFALATCVPARVAWLHDGLHGATTPGRPGWNGAYVAPLRINGGRAGLDVTGCQLAAPDAMRMLAETYRAAGGSVLSGHGSEIGWGIALAGDRVVRWLVFGAGRRGECIVVRLTQSREDFLASGRRPGRSLLDQVPDLPGSSPRLFVADDEARAAVEVSDARMTPAAALARMESQLVGAGWTPTLPVEPGAGLSILYRKGRAICIVSASPGPEGTSVTRFHKVLGGRDGL